jgi:hypothetical protein
VILLEFTNIVNPGREVLFESRCLNARNQVIECGLSIGDVGPLGGFDFSDFSRVNVNAGAAFTTKLYASTDPLVDWDLLDDGSKVGQVDLLGLAFDMSHGQDFNFTASLTPGDMIYYRALTVYNTQSRIKSLSECKDIVKGVGRLLNEKTVIFKKIDTALRGQVGAELEALIESVGSRKVFVAPAFPRIGRTTHNGVQCEFGVPIDQKDFVDDPVTPVVSADIRKVIADTTTIEFEIYDAEAQVVRKILWPLVRRVTS